MFRMAFSLPLPSDLLAELADLVQLRIEEQQGWVTIEGLADRMGCDVSRIYDLRQKGLPGRKIASDGKPSKRLYFHLPEVWAWLEAESIPV
jgi:hypothetical protein